VKPLLYFFFDPGKSCVADPYTFIFASLLVLIFGAGILSMDRMLAKRFTPKKA